MTPTMTNVRVTQSKVKLSRMVFLDNFHALF